MKNENHDSVYLWKLVRDAEHLLNNGGPVSHVCRRLGLSEKSYFRLRREYSSVDDNLAERLEYLEKENNRLVTELLDMTLDISVKSERMVFDDDPDDEDVIRVFQKERTRQLEKLNSWIEKDLERLRNGDVSVYQVWEESLYLRGEFPSRSAFLMFLDE